MDDVDDEAARALAALKMALVGLLTDLRQYRREIVVSLCMVGAKERLSAILHTLSTRTRSRGVRSGEPAEHLVSARAAVVFLVENAEALGLSAQLLLVLARTAHALSDAERVLPPGSWEASRPANDDPAGARSIQIPVCAAVQVLPVTESPAVIVSPVARLLTAARRSATARGPFDDTGSIRAGLSHLVMHGLGAKVPALAAESGRDGRPLLGARRVDAADLDRFAVGVRMGGSLGDVVKTLVRLSP